MSPVVMHLWTAAPSGFAVTSTAGSDATDEGSKVTHEFALPTNREAGDLLVLCVRFGGGSLTNADLDAPSGWTRKTLQHGSGSSAAYSRVAGASEPGEFTITLGTARRSAYAAFLVKGAGTSETDYVEGWTAESGTHPGGTPSWSGGGLWLSFLSHRSTTGTHTPPASYGNMVMFAVTAQTNDFAPQVNVARRTLATAEGTGEWTLGLPANDPHAHSIAIRPA